ncbi:MAG: isoleucine--tRNA ligase, partial [Sphingopyxis sp.]|nr:isoleucine--tRNA ligase [Sphingopyxis sp.]
ARWDEARAHREVVTAAIEPLRREKIVRSSLEAKVSMPAVPNLSEQAMAEIAITAAVTYGGESVTVTPTTDHKCGRCWRHLPEVTEDGNLCNRCETVLKPA